MGQLKIDIPNTFLTNNRILCTLFSAEFGFFMWDMSTFLSCPVLFSPVCDELSWKIVRDFHFHHKLHSNKNDTEDDKFLSHQSHIVLKVKLELTSLSLWVFSLIITHTFICLQKLSFVPIDIIGNSIYFHGLQKWVWLDVLYLILHQVSPLSQFSCHKTSVILGWL